MLRAGRRRSASTRGDGNPQASAAGTKPLDSRLRGNDEGASRRMIAVIPAQAGIQNREQFFVTLHNTSWVRDYPLHSIFMLRHRVPHHPDERRWLPEVRSACLRVSCPTRVAGCGRTHYDRHPS